MSKKEKIGIAILVILLIIFAVIIWGGNKENDSSGKINCQAVCHRAGNAGWTFPGAGPINQNSFSTQEDCVSACQVRF